MTRRLLLPETYDEIIERDQAPVPHQLSIELMAKCTAYASADIWTAYLRKSNNWEAYREAARSRDRLYTQLRPMLDALRIETAPGEGAVS
jgi:hypothetical protein